MESHKLKRFNSNEGKIRFLHPSFLNLIAKNGYSIKISFPDVQEEPWRPEFLRKRRASILQKPRALKMHQNLWKPKKEITAKPKTKIFR